MSVTQVYKKGKPCCSGDCRQGRDCPAKRNPDMHAGDYAVIWGIVFMLCVMLLIVGFEVL